MTSVPHEKNALSKLDWVLTERRHFHDLVVAGSPEHSLLDAQGQANPKLDDAVRELKVWAPSTDKFSDIPARVAHFRNLRCLALGPGIEGRAIAALGKSIIPSSVTALGVFTGGSPAKWPAALNMPQVTDLRADGPLSFSHANFPSLRAISVHPTRDRKNLEAAFLSPDLSELQLLTVPDARVYADAAHLPIRSLGLLGGKIESLEGIESLPKIEWLRLHNLRWLRSIAALRGLPNLRELEIRYCKHIEDIFILAQLKSLNRVQLIACGPLGLEGIKQFLDSLPSVQISASS